MKTEPANIYEAKDAQFTQEAERLRTFELPNTVSIEAIGEIQPNASLLDVGAGSNTKVGAYVREHGGNYTALDKNTSFVEQQRAAGANAVLGDIRELPFGEESFDIAHVRFVIEHLGEDKQKAIQQVVNIVKPGGGAIFIDYDWTAAHGSPAFNEFRDFLIHGGSLFDADFGSILEETVRLATKNEAVSITTKRHSPELMSDYLQVLNLREAGNADFGGQGKKEAVQQWNLLLDHLQKESDLTNPPGFHFPDLVVVSVTKKS